MSKFIETIKEYISECAASCIVSAEDSVRSCFSGASRNVLLELLEEIKKDNGIKVKIGTEEINVPVFLESHTNTSPSGLVGECSLEHLTNIRNSYNNFIALFSPESKNNKSIDTSITIFGPGTVSSDNWLTHDLVKKLWNNSLLQNGCTNIDGFFKKRVES